MNSRTRLPKTRRALGALALIALMVPLMGQEGCETEEPTIEKGNGGGSDQSSETTAEVGDKLTLKGTSYVVNQAEVASSLGSGYMKTKPNGVFVVVDLTLTNEKNEPATILADNLRLIGNNDSQYSTSTEGELAIDDAFVLLEEIQPGVEQSGKLVYDVPNDVVNGAELQVEDLFSSSTGRIDLGL